MFWYLIMCSTGSIFSLCNYNIFWPFCHRSTFLYKKTHTVLQLEPFKVCMKTKLVQDTQISHYWRYFNIYELYFHIRNIKIQECEQDVWHGPWSYSQHWYCTDWDTTEGTRPEEMENAIIEVEEDAGVDCRWEQHFERHQLAYSICQMP